MNCAIKKKKKKQFITHSFFFCCCCFFLGQTGVLVRGAEEEEQLCGGASEHSAFQNEPKEPELQGDVAANELTQCVVAERQGLGAGGGEAPSLSGRRRGPQQGHEEGVGGPAQPEDHSGGDGGESRKRVQPATLPSVPFILTAARLSARPLQVTLTARHNTMEAEVSGLRTQLEAEKSRFRKMQGDLQRELNVAFDENTKLTSLLDGKVPKSTFPVSRQTPSPSPAPFLPPPTV